MAEDTGKIEIVRPFSDFEDLSSKAKKAIWDELTLDLIVDWYIDWHSLKSADTSIKRMNVAEKE